MKLHLNGSNAGAEGRNIVPTGDVRCRKDFSHTVLHRLLDLQRNCSCALHALGELAGAGDFATIVIGRLFPLAHHVAEH